MCNGVKGRGATEDIANKSKEGGKCGNVDCVEDIQLCGVRACVRVCVVKRFMINQKKIDGTRTQFHPTISGEALLSANFATSGNVSSEIRGLVLFFRDTDIMMDIMCCP